ncbi:MAG: hypothetical protein AAGA96_19865, partial [Verrucomicrobiota bacterium]
SRSPTGVTEVEDKLAKVAMACVFACVLGLCLGKAGMNPLGGLICSLIATFISGKLLYGPLRGLLKGVKFLLVGALVVFILAVIAQAINS